MKMSTRNKPEYRWYVLSWSPTKILAGFAERPAAARFFLSQPYPACMATLEELRSSISVINPDDDKDWRTSPW
jgi:hypothetical protein